MSPFDKATPGPWKAIEVGSTFLIGNAEHMEDHIEEFNYLSGEPMVAQLNDDFSTDEDFDELGRTGFYKARQDRERLEANKALVTAAPELYKNGKVLAEFVRQMLDGEAIPFPISASEARAALKGWDESVKP